MQTTLFESPSAARRKAVNVASVPHRSPFRYPGGKTWFVPQIRCWLGNRENRINTLVELFAGGAIVGLSAVAENLVDRVHLVEIDPDVAAVWHAVVNGEALELANRILAFTLTEEQVAGVVGSSPATTLDRAFKTILRNRVNHGGILAPGSGVLKAGENGKGLASRWYPATLARRLTGLHQLRHRIDFTEGDAFDVMADYQGRQDVAFFVDPPYTASNKRAGSRLYTYAELDHVRLFRELQDVAGDVLITYDNDARIVELATEAGFSFREIAMKSTHHAIMDELAIGRNLDWMARC